MQNYQITCKSNVPYPLEKETRESATTFAVAIKRAVDKYRKDLNLHQKLIMKDIYIKALRI